MASKRRKGTREKLDELIAQGHNPKKRKTSEAIGVRHGKSTISMVDNAGKKTPAGLYWEQKAGAPPIPDGGFLQQAARREGNIETIVLRDGRRGVTRRWDPASNEFKFTALGKKYYATLRRNYVVDVPITIKGKRRNGTTYQIKSHMKMERLGLRPVEVPLNLTLAERRAFIQRRVAAAIQKDQPLIEVSDEQWFFDDAGSWGVHEETVGVDPETGTPEAHTILDRRTRAPEPLVSNTLLYQEALCEEAFVAANDKLCGPRQMAALLKCDMSTIIRQLSLISLGLYGTEDWEDQGVTPRMILEYCRQQGYGCVVIHNEEVMENLPGDEPTLAFAVHEDHVYFYKDKGVRRALAKRTGAEAPRRLRKVQKASQCPPASEWEAWGRDIRPGHFWALEDEMNSIRAWFLQQHKSPKVLMRDEVKVRTLIYNLRKNEENGPGVCYIHSLPEYFDELQCWLQRLDVGIEYRGEGLPALSLKVLQTLVKRSRERTWLTPEEKAAILEDNEHSCAICGSKNVAFEFDHIARLSESYGEQEFQPLCPECHREKTTQEARMYDGDQLASHFELEVWNRYVESPRPRALVGRLRNTKTEDVKDMEIADVIRCRRSALLYNVHPIPVFCPLDDIKERGAGTELGDLNYVTKEFVAQGGAARYGDNLVRTSLGYCGPGWQHRVQTEWLLHTSVITWDDISHTLTATAHLPANILAEPLERMEQAWLDNSVLAKLSVNSLIGLWAIDEASTLKVQTSTREDDAPRQGCLTSTFHYDGGFVYDFLTRTKLISNASCRPLHDICMCTEAVRVGQMLLALKLSNAIPYELKTDSVLFKAKKRKPVRLDQLTFKDLGNIYTKGYPLARPTTHLGAILSDCHPFRQAKAAERDLLRGGGAEPDTPAAPAPPNDDDKKGTTAPRRAWRGCSPEEGERRVLEDKQSLFVQGIAGTGKTTFMQGVVERLRAAGEVVNTISKTHVASRRAGGVTADHWVRRHVINGSPKCTVLWIDEISQLDVGLLLQISKLTFCQDIRFLISGDFNQFEPIGNNFRGAPVGEDALQRSNLLHTMANGNVVTLTECRRSDKVLFDFYASLVQAGSRDGPPEGTPRWNQPLQSIITEARTVFNHSGFCKSNLVISHKKRIQLNRHINEQLAPPRDAAVRLEVHGKQSRGNAAQTMLIWPGIELLGAVPSERKGIRNGCLYTVANVEPDAVTLQELPGLKLTFDQVKSWLRLSYAQTYASVQGTEFSAQVRLHDTKHRFFTRRHLFVGLSRARAAKDVSVVD